MNPSMTPWGVRGREDLTVAALAWWQHNLDQWIGPWAHEPGRPQRRPWRMPPTHGPSGVWSDAAG
jgi:hypothetical protein